MKEESIEQSGASSTEIEHKKGLPKYEPPEIKVYNEEEMLQNVAVLGCSPFPPT